VEDRITRLENKIDIKEKNRRTLSQTTQELSKEYARIQQLRQRPNLRNVGTEEGEEVQPKGIHNIFNKIIAEIFLNLKKELPI
jgi:hypothetical protein